MKTALVLVAAVLLATPALFVPNVADAQVLAGRRDSRPPLDEREQRQLDRAYDESGELEEKIAELEEAAETAGGLSEQQQAQLAGHKRRLEGAKRTIERLEARRARREN